MRENSTFKETTIDDYVPKIKEAFPDLEESDIKRIIQYGWRLIYIGCMAGCDILVSSNTHKFWFYIGSLFKNPLRHYNYYKKKLIRKMRFIYKRTSPYWDGYYYTVLTDEEYKQFNTKGRKRRHFTFYNKKYFKFKDPSRIYYPEGTHVIRFKTHLLKGFSFYKEEFDVTDPEVVEHGKFGSFQDILVNNNNYELL